MKILRPVYAVPVILGSLLCSSLLAQTPPTTAFEVASIKPAPSMQTLMMDIQSGKRGIGSLQSTINDARVDLGYVSLSNMLMVAYRIKEHQIVGPDWLSSQAFEVHARIPEGGSKDQVPEMMQLLLEERFKLVAHRENRDQQVYALIVSGGGHRLQQAGADVVGIPESAEDPAKTPPAGNNEDNLLSLNTPEGKIKVKQEGRAMVVSGGKSGQMRINVGPKGVMSLEVEKMTMADFTVLLTQMTDRPVMDRTDLKGSYHVSLEIPMGDLLAMAQKIAPKTGIPLPPDISGSGALVGASPGAGGLAASDPSGSGIHQAIRKLGLKLDSQKAPVETLVIDHIEKTPTEN